MEKPKDTHTYILLNKPIDCVTTAKDQFGRQTVLDLVKTNKRKSKSRMNNNILLTTILDFDFLLFIYYLLYL